MTEVADFRALISGYSWNGMTRMGSPVFVSYAFLEPAELPTLAEYQPYTNSGYSSFSTQQRSSFKLALAEFEKFAGVRFIEVDNPVHAAIKVISTSGSPYGGWAAYGTAEERYSSAGYLVIDGSKSGGNYAPGSGAFEVILHELGHSMGLKHPFEGDPTLTSSLDNDNFTLMSYTSNKRADTTLASLDIDALQFLYGGAEALSASWNYDWSEATQTFTLVGAAGGDVLVGLHASSNIYGMEGNDTIWGRSGNDVLFGGNGNDILGGGDGTDILYGEAGNDTFVFVDWEDTYNGGEGTDTVSAANRDYSASIYLKSNDQHHISIENIIGSAHDDYLWGDDADNAIFGGGGADNIRGYGGNDSLNGGDGIDTVRYDAYTGDFAITPRPGQVFSVVDSVAGRNGADELRNVELLSFYDGVVDLSTYLFDWKTDIASLELVATTYQFFTGRLPGEAGFEYLISSSINTADLNDPYYAQFNTENRFFNFSNNLATYGETSAAFDARFGALSFHDTLVSAYSEIIGPNTSSISFFLNAYDYFAAVANERVVPGGTSLEKAVKIVAIGSILNEAMKSDAGVMPAAINSFVEEVSTIGTSALFGQDLFGGLTV